MDETMEIKQQNETIAQKFLTIETEISLAQDVRGLYETFLVQTAEEFDVPYIWFSFISNPDMEDLLKQLDSSELLKDRINVTDAPSFSSLINNRKPLLANNDLKPFYKLLPKSNKYFIKSLAIAPIFLNGAMIGSLNYGDANNQRYRPDLDTTLLQGLAEKFSSHLSNLLMGEQAESSADCRQPNG